MCLAYPGKVISMDGDQAVADFDGVRKSVNLSLVKNAKINEYVIVHAGFAITVMGEEEALETMALIKKMEQE